MVRMSEAAKSIGLFRDCAPFLSEAEAARLPKEKVLWLATGSQGEPRAALARVAAGAHPHLKLGEGDAAIFSSRVIPGNELAIRALQNRLADLGVRLYTERDHPGIHVSGHPCRGELARMYQWARPEIAVPTHGERRHLLEHAALARDLQVPQQVTPRNGEMVRLAPGPAAVIDEVPSGRLYLDGRMITPSDGEALAERRHAAFNGMLAVSLALDHRNRVAAGPTVRALGLPHADEEEQAAELAEAARRALSELSADQRDDDGVVQGALSRALKKAAFRIWERRPVVEASVLRV
jgi:ribonuclease J